MATWVTFHPQSSKPSSTLRNGPTNPWSKSNSPSLHPNQCDSWGGGVLHDVSGCEGNSLGHRPGQGQIRRPHRLPRVGPGGGHGGVLGVGARAVAGAGAVAAVAAVGDAQFVGGEDADALLAQGQFVVAGVHCFSLCWCGRGPGDGPRSQVGAPTAPNVTLFSRDIWMTKTTAP